MSKTTATMIGLVFACQFVSACATPQWVNYQLSESAQRHHGEQDYLPKIVVKESGKSRLENQYRDIRYY